MGDARTILGTGKTVLTINDRFAEYLTDQDMGSTSKAGIVLIPWDPESPEHIERLYQQRVACGWYEDLIESWRPRQRSGNIALQWIVRETFIFSLHPHFTTCVTRQFF